MNNKISNFASEECPMSKYLLLTNNNEVVRVSPERIVYIHSNGNCSYMILTGNEKHAFSFNLAKFEKILQEQLNSEAHILIRLGKQLIINSKYIYYINITKQEIILSDISFPAKFTLDVSREALRKLKTDLEEDLK
ncbi:LytTR family transcriptional regulator DNA-binding domain-containing protein [Odoribacter sp. OttesenSCG-928-L07]|nr:LytTR family transcriptional regulator DNA-binding domain-containing protein [Odoribacter sp. OttesenSCG-928-L07]